MADKDDPLRLMPSVLDRLLGQEVPTQENLDRNRAQFFRQLKASLQRDLENLLNTRCRCGAYPKELTELQTSLVNYGIPDFTGASVASVGSREDFLRIVRDAIQRFEPRLTQVKVSHIGESKEPLDRVLRFRIEAVLLPDHEAEPVAFLSTLEPASGKYRVDGG